jgi:arylsulfatase A
MLARRAFIKRSMAAGMCCSLLTRGNRVRASNTRRPNFIYIMADDLGYANLSCYGQKKFNTPFLDSMAAEGIRFTDHYAGAPLCAPSRCALLTGMHIGHARVRNNSGAVPLLPGDVTIAEILRKAGYATGIIGKWGLGDAGSTGIPNQQGFDYFFGYLNQREAHRHYPAFLWRNGRKVLLEGNNPEAASGPYYSHDLFTKEAFEFVRRNRHQPFFLYLAYTIPHAELVVPADSMTRYLGAFDETPYGGKAEQTYAPQSSPRAAFAGMVSRLDRDVGSLLALLKDLDIDGDTLVMFSSDNGPATAGGADPDFFDSSGPLRGSKRDLYEGGIRVPLIARWPGHIPAATVSDLPSANGDILPTLAKAAGIEPPDNIDGIPLLPTLLGTPATQAKHTYLYWECDGETTAQALRIGYWKAMRPAPNRPLELYNLASDIGEEQNVADANPAIVAQIQAYLDLARTPSPDTPLQEHTIWVDMRRLARRASRLVRDMLQF